MRPVNKSKQNRSRFSLSVQVILISLQKQKKLMYRIARFFLFFFNPERAHHIAFWFFKRLQQCPWLLKTVSKSFHKYDKPVTVFGITFPNRIGLAAGLDKDAEVFDALGALGFGHIEIGTITPQGQSGNPKPRLFRLTKDKALINRMGFNNSGVEVARNRLEKRKTGIIICGNIGKNKVTPNEEAVNDYEKAFLGLYPVVDYFVVNVSSPNTPNLRELQDKKPLKRILNRLMTINKQQEKQKPVLLKIAPDLTFQQIDDVLEIIAETGINGIVATNTTIERSPLTTDSGTVKQLGNGGLSGKPLTNRSTEIIRYIAQKTGSKLPIIGVGGIMTPEDAVERIKAGATLVQLYTGFIYGGPWLIKKINRIFLNK